MNIQRLSPVAQQSSRSRPKKRVQVARACDWCRIHRVKCDNNRPCSNCRSRDGQCSNNSAKSLVTLPQAYREVEQLKQRVRDLEAELELQKQCKVNPPANQFYTPNSLPTSPPHKGGSGHVEFHLEESRSKRFGEGIHISTARSPQKTWYGSSSLFYFIGRINTFLTSALHQSHSTHRLLPNSASYLLDGPTAVAADDQSNVSVPAGDLTSTGEYLSPTQEEYFLGLFWQSYYTSCPILDELEFKQHYQSLWATSDKERKPSALVDIVVAVCMQYGMALLPGNDRGSNTEARALVSNSDATIAGRWHYRRCQTLLSSQLESPTLATLQCHILSSIYLCCGSFQNMADNACTLAVRTAFMLGLHLEPPSAMPRKERELRKRIWWTLYVLESKMSMKLGRPFLLHRSSTACSLPSDDRETSIISGSGFAPLGENVTWLTWNLVNTKLILAARKAYTAFYLDGPDTPYDGRHHAGLQQLEEWLRNVPDAIKTKRQNNGIPFSTDLSDLDIEQFAPLWLQRQRLLLELMYHNLSTNFCRPSIEFDRTSQHASFPEETAVRCAAHAMALTHIMHQVITRTSILAGWHEAFQWQWNTAMTLVGFILAYPQASSTMEARKSIDLAVIVFETFGNSFAVAASAANILGDLITKMDISQNIKQSSSVYQHAHRNP
ncbi:fungal-specific transcription factor domain-containing protein [Bisporella sp. PMI_857]|nr:fungal-specific transcription factor domain-containing protein [Bisporella sp. PMI_857]